MKNNYISLFYILFLILGSSFGEVRADELIRYNMDEVTTSGTIIRHYKEGMDVVCYQLSYKAYFFMYKEGVATSHALYVDMDTITDFEIYDDTVYFCGRRHETVAGWATFGYFDVASLVTFSGSANVEYLHLPLMDDVGALEVGWIADRKHVVILGKDLKDEAMVLDAIDESSYWNMNFAEMGADTTDFVDLAITESYVVATSEQICHDGMGCEYGGCLWIINKPVMSGASLFPSNVYWRDIAHYSMYGVRPQIKAMGLDDFVTVYQRNLYPIGFNPFTISYYNGITHYKCFLIEELSDLSFRLGDIGYENNAKNVELLIYGPKKTSTESAYRSVIFEIPDVNTLPDTLSIVAHIYDGVYFESLDYTFDREHFVASGIEQPAPYFYKTPYYMKFKHGYFDGNCLEKRNNIIRKIEIDYREVYKQITRTNIHQVPEMKEFDKKEMQIETPCMSMTNGNK